jgi:rsbT co-antagonist protein RsbR
VIIDVTGIDVMDTRTVDHFIRMARAVELLGADCVLTGLSPALAQTIVQVGVEIRGIRTYQTLRQAIRSFVIRPAINGNGNGAR